MQISIGFSGPAGSGINTAGIWLAETLSNKGYTVYGDKEYASVIRGKNNCFFLYITDEQLPFISKTINFFLATDEYAITKNQEIYNLEKVLMFKNEKCTYKNTFAFGASIKILGIPLNEGKKIVESHLKEKKNLNKDQLDQNFNDLENGYTYIDTFENIKKYNLDIPIGTEKTFMFGNELIAKGAITSKLEFYSAYPMTPASSIIDEITKDKNIIFYQGEDEIAVSMAMLGAKYAGKRAMCGTSGGGFALMSESIAFSNQAEIGGVYILSQRDGPSTGTPTFTGQSDIDYALHASFGDTNPIVIVPSSFEETHNLIGEALNYSDIYQHPVIFLVDKQLSESYLSIDKKELKAPKILEGEKAKGGKEDNYKRYEITKNGISPYAIPGEKNTKFIATSYEHDEYGCTNENPNIKKHMIEKRAKKIETFIETEFNEKKYGYEIINPNAKYFYISFGINSYVLKNHIKKNTSLGLIIIKYFYPFDKRLKTFLDTNFKNIDSLCFVELNHSGAFENLVRKECELYKERNSKIKHLRKYDLYPLFEEDIN